VSAVRWRARLGDLVHITVITFIAAIVNAPLVFGCPSPTGSYAAATRRPVRAPLAGVPVLQ
jgi:hypothetical protein